MMLAALMAGLALGMAVEVPLGLGGLAHETVTFRDHGKPRSCQGVKLSTLLARAGAPMGDDVRGAALSMMVVVDAADGYRAVFSLGETDAKLGAASLWVVDRCAGKALEDGEGPIRIVAPAEARGARSVRAVTRIRLVTLEEGG